MRRGRNTAGSEPPATDPSGLSGAVDRGEEVGEGPVRACGVAGCVKVHEEATDDSEHDGGQLGPAEATHAGLERFEPVGGRGPPEARPEWFSRRVVQPAEHAQVGLALRPGDRRPCAGQGHRVGLVGSQAYELGEGLDLAPPGLSQDLAEQSVTGLEVVDQHPARGARGGRQRPKPIREPVLERVVGARVEKPLLDLRLALSAHQVIFSRNARYVYYRSTADRDTTRR